MLTSRDYGEKPVNYLPSIGHKQSVYDIHNLNVNLHSMEHPSCVFAFWVSWHQPGFLDLFHHSLVMLLFFQ